MSNAEGKPEIAIRVHTIAQLFNSFDPSPFLEKDLDTAAENFLVGWVRDLPRMTPFTVAVYLPAEEVAKPEAAELETAFANYFETRAQEFDRELRELFRIGRRSLAIGVAVLAACLTASQLLAPLVGNPTAARVIEESLIIVGWVANWRPIEIYLYDWWPIRRRCQLYRRIAAAPVSARSC